MAIFINDIYIGSCVEFEKYLSVEYDIVFNLWSINYKQLISTDVQDYYNNNKVNVIKVKNDCHIIIYIICTNGHAQEGGAKGLKK